ncbi:MAG: ABC transporter substrate-binding protein [Alphaproteobacteria bacterium]|nr:ABC transporter substrate-binding protein [Alphaproteobacteria bacterium]
MIGAAGPFLSRRAVHRVLALGLVAAVTTATPHPVLAEETPERIVSIGGSVTEIVHALGLGDRIIAADTTSLYPPETEALPKVGYMRQLAVEPILAMNPGIIIHEPDAGPPAVLEQLAATGIELVSVPDDPSPEGVIAKIQAVADALKLSDDGAALANRFMADLSAARAAVGTETKPRVLFLIGIQNRPFAAGTDTSAASIIDLAGGENAVTGFDGYKPLSPEAAIAARPDAILVTDRTLAMMGGKDAILARPELAPTPAAAAGRLISLDGLLLLGFGPRTPDAVKALRLALSEPSLAEKAVR